MHFYDEWLIMLQNKKYKYKQKKSKRIDAWRSYYIVAVIYFKYSYIHGFNQHGGWMHGSIIFNAIDLNIWLNLTN